ncbi:PPOX class F420-dependent enzyme [Amycolatopsis antarctica]|uniref:PPOX class F420-dependent enzyme n=1 Tax=Amycolatopsis antarctica TaxID=1854586 RepID=A0A263D1L2_9PSEU|nr:PPOX class F420-dependent oxidoreductase [Amycolatopsis antarctica]OZM72374.1 PPOX class F420-dependent enzyme [Amycolatopsis antarctica]
MRAMTRDEWWDFAATGSRTGMLGVTRKDGSPHVTPVWFVLAEGEHGDELIFNTGSESVKGRALDRDPRLSLCVDEAAPPFSFVQFTARARLVTDLGEMRHWATVIGGRYMGPDRAEAFGERNAVPGEYLVRATISKVLAHAAVAD